MQVTRFLDEYDLVAPLYGLYPATLRERDRDGSPSRWLGLRNGVPVAVVDSFERPDRRTFLRFRGDDPSDFGHLGATVGGELGRPVYAVADESDSDRLTALQSAGFTTEVVVERFRIDFGVALDFLRHARPARGFTVRAADEVDEERLFALDNHIRNDVPGSEGWEGNREWFREELRESPPFDPTGYLVAVDDADGEYAGLVRMWRNPSGPRLGLIGVARQYRGSPVAPDLLRRALTAASSWGHDTFATETSPSNRATHPRMRRLRAEPEGRFHQLVLALPRGRSRRGDP